MDYLDCSKVISEQTSRAQIRILLSHPFHIIENYFLRARLYFLPLLGRVALLRERMNLRNLVH
jgi:hypothetical protein